MSTVDVVIPCYNYARYLSGCVESVLSQAGVEVRLLIIDDASSDNTLEVGQALALTDRRIEYLRHDVNKGNISTYNEGLLGWASAEYVVLLSADDMLAAGSLNRAVGIMNGDKNIGMVYGPVIHFREEGALPKGTAKKFTYTRFSGAEWLNVRCRAGHNVITSPEVVVRRTVQQAVGGYRSELPHAGDLEMWLRIAAVSDVAFVRRVPQAFYRVHSLSMTKERTSFVDLRQRKAAFDLFFRCHPDLPNGHVLRGWAGKALAREALWQACRAYDRNEVKEASADELVQFASEACPSAAELPESRALRRRKALGPLMCKTTQIFAASGALHRAHRMMKTWQWKRRGI